MRGHLEGGADDKESGNVSVSHNACMLHFIEMRTKYLIIKFAGENRNRFEGQMQEIIGRRPRTTGAARSVLTVKEETPQWCNRRQPGYIHVSNKSTHHTAFLDFFFAHFEKNQQIHSQWKLSRLKFDHYKKRQECSHTIARKLVGKRDRNGNASVICFFGAAQVNVRNSPIKG